MSYEGYEVLVCAKGHYNCFDHFDVIGNPSDQPHCDCGEPIVHIGSVDETNCLPYILDFKLVIKTPEVVETCPCCKHGSVKEEATYTFVKVPPYESPDGNFIFNESGSNALIVNQIPPKVQKVPAVVDAGQLARATDWRDVQWVDSQTNDEQV